MLGKIIIEDYKVHCVIGVHPHERVRDQEVSLTLELIFDAKKATESDSLHDTIDYEGITEICKQLGQSKKYHLIEKFAFDALELLFQKYPLQRGKVKVTKKGAIPLASSVSFEMERGK